MSHEIKFDGKSWRVYSSVVDDFISAELKTLDAVEAWSKEDCSSHPTMKKAFASVRDLTCRCNGKDFAGEVEDDLRFLNGVSIFGADHEASVPYQTKEISRPTYCELVASRARTDAIEAKIKWEIESGR